VILSGSERGVGLWQGTFSNGNVRQVIVTPDKVYSDSGTARVDVTGSVLTGGNDDRVQFFFLKNQLVLNNAVDAPRVWNGDDTTPTNTSDLATIPFSKAGSMLVHQNLLMALDTTEGGTRYPTRIRWCNINRQTYVVDINTWNDADRYEVYDGGPAIVGAVDAWGWAMIFKQDGVYPGRIVFGPVGEYDFQLGDPTTEFGPRRGFTPLAKHSFLSRPEFVFGVAKEGIFIIQPDFSFVLINSDDSEEWFNLNAGRVQYAQSYVVEREHQVRTLVSSSSNTSGHDYELVWDWDNGNLWIDRPVVARNYAQRVVLSNEEQVLVAGTDGYLYKAGLSSYSQDNTTGISWRIKMSPNDLGLPGKLKHVLNVRTLYKRRSGAGTVSVRIHLDEGRSSSVSDSFSAAVPYTWNSGVKWNTGKKWPGGQAKRADTYVNRICETLAPEWTGTQPASIEGYLVDYVPLEN